jgi:hypothetical protein
VSTLYEGRGILFDTPGVFLHHRMNSILGGDDIKRFKLGASLAGLALFTTLFSPELGLCVGHFSRDLAVKTPSDDSQDGPHVTNLMPPGSE